MTFPTHTFRFPVGVIALLVCALPLLSGCEEGSLNAPEIQSAGDNDELFNSYVAVGNSITAGFQSGGINENLQRDSYAVLLSQQMNTPFGIPVFPNPGCPPPLEQIFPPERIADEDCALRSTSTEVRNVAVPEARVVDAITNLESEGANPNELTSFVLGGRTQIEAATAQDPTFASVWLGNNDALGAALAGNPNLLTSQSDFESDYETLLDALENAGAEGGVIGNVFNVTQIPNLSPGAAYFAAKNSGQFPPTIDANFSVDNNCAPSARGGVGDQMFVSFRYGATLLQLADNGQSVDLDCTNNQTLLQIFDDATLEALGLSDAEKQYSLLTNTEVPQVLSAVSGYNSFLQQEAQERGWAYVDANGVLDNLYSQGESTPMDPSDDLIPRFPNLQGTPTFGPVFSEDGIHPNSDAHQLIANEFIDAINNQYGSSLDNVDSPSF